MIHERRASSHTNYAHLARVREYRDREPVIEPTVTTTEGSGPIVVIPDAWTPDQRALFDEFVEAERVRRQTAPAIWMDPERDEAPWHKRHPRAATVIGWAVLLAWGALFGYALVRWLD